MKTMAVSEFKAKALQVVGEVAETKEPLVITKRGKPVARLSPFTEEKVQLGKLADTFVFETDIVSPLGHEMWEACR